MSRSSNEPAAPNASNFLNNFKYEVANELGMNNYQTVDKGQLTSRENGYVGGYMVNIMFSKQRPSSKNVSTDSDCGIKEDALKMFPKQRPKERYDINDDIWVKKGQYVIVHAEDDIEFLRNNRQKGGHLHSVHYDLRVYYEKSWGE